VLVWNTDNTQSGRRGIRGEGEGKKKKKDVEVKGKEKTKLYSPLWGGNMKGCFPLKRKERKRRGRFEKRGKRIEYAAISSSSVRGKSQFIEKKRKGRGGKSLSQ